MGCGECFTQMIALLVQLTVRRDICRSLFYRKKSFDSRNENPILFT
jgi:hypothetical protein